MGFEGEARRRRTGGNIDADGTRDGYDVPLTAAIAGQFTSSHCFRRCLTCPCTCMKSLPTYSGCRLVTSMVHYGGIESVV